MFSSHDRIKLYKSIKDNWKMCKYLKKQLPMDQRGGHKENDKEYLTEGK